MRAFYRVCFRSNSIQRGGIQSTLLPLGKRVSLCSALFPLWFATYHKEWLCYYPSFGLNTWARDQVRFQPASGSGEVT